MRLCTRTHTHTLPCSYTFILGTWSRTRTHPHVLAQLVWAHDHAHSHTHMFNFTQWIYFEEIRSMSFKYTDDVMRFTHYTQWIYFEEIRSMSFEFTDDVMRFTLFRIYIHITHDSMWTWANEARKLVSSTTLLLSVFMEGELEILLQMKVFFNWLFIESLDCSRGDF